MKIDGACHCGYIRVEGDADPEKTTVCHCTDCQVGNGSAFRVNVPIPGATFRITGQPATYLKTTAESGNPRLQAFCPRCGSPIYSTSPGEGQQASYMVRVGILRQRRDFVPRISPRIGSRIAANSLKSEKHCPPNLGVRNLTAAALGGSAADNVADLPILLWRLRQRWRGDTAAARTGS